MPNNIHIIDYFLHAFTHLRRDSKNGGEKGDWWQLVPNAGCEIWIENAGSMRSFGNLSAAVAYAEIDPNLATLLRNKESRAILKHIKSKFITEVRFLGGKL